MALNLSLSEILAKLQQQIASLREQVDLHARQEEHHRDQRALLEAELRKALAHLESFQAVAGTAAELDLPGMAPASPPLQEDLVSNPTLGRLVAWVVANRPEGERFGPKLVAHEIRRRFPKALRRPVDPPAVSIVLRRMSAARRIHQVREGKPNHEALYTKGPQPPAAKRDDDR